MVNKGKQLVPEYDINSKFKFAKLLELPTCSPSVFPEDFEICISYGLLPHKILGVIYKDYFYVNPNIFSGKRTLTDAIKIGFYIDQTNFTEMPIMRCSNGKTISCSKLPTNQNSLIK